MRYLKQHGMSVSLLLVGLLMHSGIIHSQGLPIPDPNFEQALIDLGIDTDGLNGWIQDTDAQNVTSLDVSGKTISDLSGIEAFSGLVTLDCSYNELSFLELSGNVTLEAVMANNNQLISIGLSNLSNLQGVHVQQNQLQNIDLSDCPNLFSLYCWENELQNLDVSENTEIIMLSCGENQLTGTLNISGLYNLKFFSCRFNQLDTIQLYVHPHLSSFNCKSNNITELDLSLCPALEYIYVDSNALQSLNVNNWTNVNVITFDARENTDLFCIQVDNAVYSDSQPNWLKDTQAVYSTDCSVVGFSELLDGKMVIIYPNPTSDELTIEHGMGAGVITDLSGKEVLQFECTGEKTIISVRDLPVGDYLLRIGGHVSLFYKKE